MNKTPLVPSDLYRLLVPSDPNVASDGRVYFVRARHDEKSDEIRTSIWAVRGEKAPVRFTNGNADKLPRPSPDGKSLAFVGDRGEGKRVYVVPTDGGEAVARTEAYDAITGLAWSDDGERIAFTATATLDAVTAKIARDERTKALHVRGLPFKSDDDGLLDGRRKHLFVMGAREGDAVQATRGDFDVHGLSWSPDGTRIAFCARIGGHEAGFSEDLHVVTLADGSLTTLSPGKGPSQTPAFSPDGNEIAYVAHEHGDDIGGRYNLELFCVPAAGGATRSLSAGTDRPAYNYLTGDTRAAGAGQAPVWSANGSEIYTTHCDEGACGIAAFPRAGGSHRLVIGGERDVAAFTLSRDGTLAFAFSTPTAPGEIGVLSPDGRERVATECNPWLAERTIRAPRRIRPASRDGVVLDQWILEPDGDTPAPYVVAVHGGPHMAYGFTFMFEFQMLAGHGIGVAFGNPRGGQTYGHDFANAVLGRWGEVDADDVHDLTDALLGHAKVDASRLAVAGGSYGGFMTTWLLGHSKRFSCGISMRAVNDFVSEVGATDLGWFLEAELEAPWADGGRKLFERSPMRAAHDIEVPLLIEHSERDYRCAIDQGEQLFTLLRRLGRRNVEFVRFTGDGHGLSRTGKPRNRVLRLRAIAHWLIRHLRPAGQTPIEDKAGALFEPLPAEA